MKCDELFNIYLLDDIEEQLGVNELYDENLTSDSVVYLLQKPMDTDEIHKQV